MKLSFTTNRRFDRRTEDSHERLPNLRRPLRLLRARTRSDVVDGIRDFPGKIEPHVVEGAGISDVIRECAEKLGADLIVMGTHGRTGLAHVFLGSVAERTRRSAPCPVLTIQSPEEVEAD